mgnify:CR=1 FL=1
MATIPVTGLAIPAPDVAIAPESLRVTLILGQTSEQVLHIANRGGSALRFELPQPPPAPVGGVPHWIQFDVFGGDGSQRCGVGGGGQPRDERHDGREPHPVPER